jgi:RND family efflux transporter MFP subunit
VIEYLHLLHSRLHKGTRAHALVAAVFAIPGALQAQELSAPSVVRAREEATLSSSISGRVDALPFEEGAKFEAGDSLAEINCAIYRSEAEAALAERAGAFAAAASREALYSRGGIGRLDVDLAKAEAAAAAARARSAELRVQACQILAPYDGRVAEHVVNAFEYVEQGQAVLSIVSIESPDLEIIAPAEWLRWVKPGTVGRLRLEAKQSDFNITVETVGPIVDPVSRTVKLRASFDGDTNGVLPGMSGLVMLERND